MPFIKNILKDIIDINLLTFYHNKLNDYLNEKFNNKLNKNENAVSATKLKTPITINGVNFDGTQNISIKANANMIIVNQTLLSNQTKIIIDKKYKINNNIFTWLFINGIKQKLNEQYTIDENENSITLLESFKNDCDIEVVIF